MTMKTLLLVDSTHHHNTEKVGRAMAEVLNAIVKSPKDVTVEDVLTYDLIGFGSGIYSAKHASSLLALAESLPPQTSKKAFLFSTSAIVSKQKLIADHQALRIKLQTKGFILVDEFCCLGFNTNSFLKYFGGMNKGRPNEEDLQNAKRFAETLKARF